MSVFKNIGKSIKNMGTGISERAKTHSETTSLNNIIKGEQCKIDSQYKLIGKLYFEKYGDNAEDEFRQSVEIIKASNVKIAETENKIAEIKNRFNCPNCGTPFKNDAIFCSKCGTRLQPEQPPAESSQRVCAGCGSVLEEGAMFCTVCGAKAENAAEVPVNASEPAIEPVQPEANENNSVTEEQSNELQNEVKTDEVSEKPQNEKAEENVHTETSEAISPEKADDTPSEPKPAMFCPNCRNEIHENDLFCDNCGSKLK